MTSPRVLYLSGFGVAEAWRSETERIFGPGVRIVPLSPVGLTPAELVEAVRAAQPDSVVLATALPAQRQAVQALGSQMAILRPLYERVRARRGEMEERRIGLGLLQGQQICPLADGALADCGAVKRIIQAEHE